MEASERKSNGFIQRIKWMGFAVNVISNGKYPTEMYEKGVCITIFKIKYWVTGDQMFCNVSLVGLGAKRITAQFPH